MASDATVCENDPVTPAHQFAWRAFRGFVFGSPESSPEHTNAIPQPQKENYVSSSSSCQSPHKRRVSMAPPPTVTASLLSPQKRKRDSLPLLQPNPHLLSPTKSILRTPGAAPTPRAKSLRDVNVKFKSVSPEARSGPVPIPVPLPRSMTMSGAVSAEEVEDLEKQVDQLWEELEQSLVEGRSPPRANVEEPRLAVEKPKPKPTIEDARNGVVIQPVPEQSSKGPVNVDHEEYARRTEKEVKRLLRQHKKLRDYAKRADEQNMDLHAMVEELRKENARLTARLENAGATTNMKSVAGQAEACKRGASGKQIGKRDDEKGTARPRTDRNDKARENATEVSKSKSDSFERSLRGSLANFSIHEDNTLNYKRQKTIECPTTTIITQGRLSPKKRSSTTPDLRCSFPATRKEPLFASNMLPDRPSQSLRGTNSGVLNVPDAKPTATAVSNISRAPEPATMQYRRHVTYNSPLSLTALAAQLEPTPRPPAIPSSSSVAGIDPLPLLTTTTNAAPAILNMAPDRVAAARARLQAKRKASGITNNNAYATTATANTASNNAVDANNGATNVPADMNLGTSNDADATGVGVGAAAGHQTSLLLQEAMAKDVGFCVGYGAESLRGEGEGERATALVGGGVAIGGGGAAAEVLVDQESALDWAKI